MPTALALRRQPVQRILRDLEDSQWWSVQRIRDLQLQKLQTILHHAYASSPFYRQRFNKIGVNPGDVETLEDLKVVPVLEKSDLAPLAATTVRSRFKRGPWDTRMTAGSTGTPSVVYADRVASASCLAARYRALSWYGIEAGSKEVRFWGRPTTKSRVRQRIKDLLLNRLRIDSHAMFEGRIAATYGKIARFSPNYFYGYSSMIIRFAEFLTCSNAWPRQLNLQAAIFTSETSLPFERMKVGKVLDCPTVNEYGCSEVDIISFSCPEGGNHIVAENVYVEILPRSDSPSDPGEVVITDLNNTLMPLIRYRIGDISQYAVDECPCGRGLPCLAEISGRIQDVYIVTSAGHRIHTQSIAYIFEELVQEGVKVNQFKVVQETTSRLKLYVAAPSLDVRQQRHVKDRVEREIMDLLGRDFVCQTEFVDQLNCHNLGRKFSHFESRLAKGLTYS